MAARQVLPFGAFGGRRAVDGTNIIAYFNDRMPAESLAHLSLRHENLVIYTGYHAMPSLTILFGISYDISLQDMMQSVFEECALKYTLVSMLSALKFLCDQKAPCITLSEQYIYFTDQGVLKILTHREYCEKNPIDIIGSPETIIGLKGYRYSSSTWIAGMMMRKILNGAQPMFPGNPTRIDMLFAILTIDFSEIADTRFPETNDIVEWCTEKIVQIGGKTFAFKRSGAQELTEQDMIAVRRVRATADEILAHPWAVYSQEAYDAWFTSACSARSARAAHAAHAARAAPTYSE